MKVSLIFITSDFMLSFHILKKTVSKLSLFFMKKSTLKDSAEETAEIEKASTLKNRNYIMFRPSSFIIDLATIYISGEDKDRHSHKIKK